MSTVLEYGILSAYFAALFILLIFGAHGFVMVYYYKKYRGPTGLRPKSLARPPRVTVQLPVFNEYYVIERLIRAACRLDYPRALLEIQVLDDSTDETLLVAERCVDEYRRQGFDIKLLHREDRRGYKAGALREGLASATGEFIAIFDADFIPPRDFLMRTLPYFSNKKIGMVQTRWGHLNRDYSILTRLQAIGLDGHFVIEQAARNGAGFFINFNGTAGIWRKACILDAGNWSEDTLTEDLDLSYRAQLRGWNFKYLTDTVCDSELPAEIGALRSQQFRWTKGAIETAKKILPLLWRAALPLRLKLQGTVHLTNNLVFPFILIVSLLNPFLVWIKNEGSSNHSFYFGMTSLFALSFWGSFLMYLHSQKALYPDWRRKILGFPLFMSGSMGLAWNNTRAIVLGLCNRRSEFTRTPKYRIESNVDQFRGKIYFNATKRRSRLTATGIFEIMLACYSLAGIGLSVYYLELAAIPFQSLFAFGYGFIGYLSLKDMVWPQIKARWEQESWLLGRVKGALQLH